MKMNDRENFSIATSVKEGNRRSVSNNELLFLCYNNGFYDTGRETAVLSLESFLRDDVINSRWTVMFVLWSNSTELGIR